MQEVFHGNGADWSQFRSKGSVACVCNTRQPKRYHNFNRLECSSTFLKVGSDLSWLLEESWLGTIKYNRQQSDIKNLTSI